MAENYSFLDSEAIFRYRYTNTTAYANANALKILPRGLIFYLNVDFQYSSE